MMVETLNKKEFTKLSVKHEISCNFFASRIPQQNGDLEKKNWNLKEYFGPFGCKCFMCNIGEKISVTLMT